ncbi:MAG TPA: ATP-dependent metallopeptidase FtsH/Yme1/Tma family protein, partial [Candidatus Dormibacteraeota bacterium]|nr:ATP-dependent metallopeptidase FtsH/Yme1/Tma family protein [Candidatus Dormibacteraeota bacterium]
MRGRIVLAVLGLGLGIGLGWLVFRRGQPATWSYSRLVEQAAAGQVSSVRISGSTAVATDRHGRSFDVALPPETSRLASQLIADHVGVSFQSQDSALDLAQTFLPYLLVALLTGGLMYLAFRQTQGGTTQVLSFGRSRARMIAGDKPQVTFADVAGVEEAKQELTEIVEFLKYPEKFVALGARIPKGVLMV